MTIYRGVGGGGNATSDSEINALTTLSNAAAASETAAGVSASAAGASAASAAASSSTASASASSVAASAATATTQATNASTSAAGGATSASNAADSAAAALQAGLATTNGAAQVALATTQAELATTNGAAQVSLAATQAGNAASSASTAASQATAAASSASAASTSETNAATSETNAASSAAASSSSASSASASADAALTALDSFDDRYLGQQASNPTVDNDGNALVAGALYFNTTDSVMKVYEGSSWVAAYASLSGALIAVNNLSDLVSVTGARTNLGLGTAATTAATAYATAAQGALADSATQPANLAAIATTGSYADLVGTVPTWNQNTTGSSASTTGNAATATNVAYSGLTGTVPTWNQNTTGNAATATNVAYSGLTGTVPTWNQNTTGSSASCTGNAATATNVAYSGLTGTAPTWNQNTTGTAGNTSSITSATGSSFTWTGVQLFQSNQDTTGSNAPLQVYSSSGGAIMSFHRAGVFAINMGLDSDNVFRIGGWSAAANRLQMDMSGNLTMAGNVTAYSDERLKKDWEEVKPNFVDHLANVKSGTYTRTDSDERQAGVSAQSLQELLPETVIAGEDGILSVAYGNAAMVAVVELAKEIRMLKEEIKALKGV